MLDLDISTSKLRTSIFCVNHPPVMLQSVFSYNCQMIRSKGLGAWHLPNFETDLLEEQGGLRIIHWKVCS